MRSVPLLSRGKSDTMLTENLHYFNFVGCNGSAVFGNGGRQHSTRCSSEFYQNLVNMEALKWVRDDRQAPQ